VTTRKLSLLALFIAISVIGGFIKIPAIIGSVALDLFPALMAAVYLGRTSGALVAGVGHLASALIGGLPLGPIHMVVALSMALIVYFFEIIYARNRRLLAAIFLIVTNALVAPLPMMFLFSMEFYLAIVPSLFIGSLINTIVALLLVPRFQPIFKRIATN